MQIKTLHLINKISKERKKDQINNDDKLTSQVDKHRYNVLLVLLWKFYCFREKWETGSEEDLSKREMGDRVRGRSMEGRNGRQGQRKLVMCDLSNGCHCLWNLLVRKVSDHRLLIVPSLVFLLFLKTNKHLKSFHISDIRLFLELLC